MLISPPFLLPNDTRPKDDAWVEAVMPGGHAGDGSFPVSNDLGWHGGMHITALVDKQGNALPVRAIADGTVVYVRQPKRPNDHRDDPLNYNGGWTSDGVVVVRHETDIGTGPDATRVEFFSIYMHLSAIDRGIVFNHPVYRKYPIGQPGQIYGSQERKIQLEIIFGDTTLRRLAGRISGDVPLNRPGRTDAVYGECYVRLPSGTLAYVHEPPANQPVPPGNVAPAYTTNEDLFVGLSYGDGNLRITTYLAGGDLVGTNRVEPHQAEYRLYERVGELSKPYQAHLQGPQPVAAAVFELLRFGRVIHTDTHLNPAGMPHWRKVAYPGGLGYVNLNAPGTTKFSDADFPQWRCWSLVDDSRNHDSRCDSPTILGWLGADSEGHVNRDTARGRLDDPAYIPRLSRVICKFATEWEEATIKARWSWLKDPKKNPTALTLDFDAFCKHATALSFWKKANLHSGTDNGNAVVPSVHWHVHPREFIKQARRCGWFSQDELARCIARYEPDQNKRGQIDTITWGQSHGNATGTMLASVNRFFQKYLGAARQRHVHALAQIFVETDHLNTMSEYDHSSWYAPYYGRGLLQLTLKDNYTHYGTYAGLPPGYDPNIVATAEHASESAGYFWATHGLGRIADDGLGSNYVGYISWVINGGPNGYELRELYAKYMQNVLLDDPPLSGKDTFKYPPPDTDPRGHYPPSDPASTHSVTVDDTQQIPPDP